MPNYKQGGMSRLRRNTEGIIMPKSQFGGVPKEVWESSLLQRSLTKRARNEARSKGEALDDDSEEEKEQPTPEEVAEEAKRRRVENKGKTQFQRDVDRLFAEEVKKQQKAEEARAAKELEIKEMAKLYNKTDLPDDFVSASGVQTIEEAKDQHRSAIEKHYIYYCINCATYCMITDEPLSDMPQRKTDEAFVLPEKKCKKNNMTNGEVKAIKRDKGVEKQYRINCSNCGNPIAYRPVEWSQPTKFMYVYDRAVTANLENCLIKPQTIGSKGWTMDEAIQDGTEVGVNVQTKMRWRQPVNKVQNPEFIGKPTGTSGAF